MAEIKIGLIGGSGLGEAMLERAGRLDGDGSDLPADAPPPPEPVRHQVDTPFGRPSDAILEMTVAGVPVFFLPRHGVGHILSPSQVPYRANLFALKKLGCTHVIASGAVGSLREEYKPRDLVIADQIIDKTHKRSGTFYEKAAVHVEFSEPFCPVLRRILLETATEVRVPGLVGGNVQESGVRGQGSSEGTAATAADSPYQVHDRGCYVCMEGPAFSTRAESLMHRLWGGDLIGMTAMPEAKLAREAEISYALVALVTDYDSWRRPPLPAAGAGNQRSAATAGGSSAAPVPPADPYVLLQEIIANLRAATDNAIDLIRRTVTRMAGRQDELAAAPARDALKLAIWSDKARIVADDVELLAPLWMKYFEK